MRVVVTVRRPDRPDADTLFDLDDAATLADMRQACAPDAPEDWCVGTAGRAFDAQTTVRDARITAGDIITVAPPAHRIHRSTARTPRPAPMRLHVIGGLGAGTIQDLAVGESTVGSAPSDDARCAHIPAAGVRVNTTLAGAATITPGTATDATINAEPLTETITWREGEPVHVGGSVIALVRTRTDTLATARADENLTREVSRPPRLLPREVQAKFTLPAAPKPPKQRSFPVVMLIMPVVLAAVLVGVTRQWHYAMFAIMSPMMMLGGWLTSKVGAAKEYKIDHAAWVERVAAINEDVAAAMRDEHTHRAALAPSPAEIAAITSTPGRRLWERRTDDPDFLTLRIGLAPLASSITVEDVSAEAHKRTTHPMLPHTPVTVDLASRGVIGLCGRPEYARAGARWLLGQVLALHSPDDVNVYVLATADRAQAWEWAPWAPHVAPGAGQQAMATIGTDSRTAATRIGELAAIVSARQALLADNHDDSATVPAIVVVVDGARVLRRNRALATVLDEGPDVGVYAICLDTHERYLPGEAGAIITYGDAGDVTLHQDRDASITDVLADLPDPEWAEPIGRDLAGLRDAGDTALGGLPTACRLAEALPVDIAQAEHSAEQWARQPRCTTSPIGAAADGLAQVDIVRDGPHALVAGTTGAGKSELLQSWIAGLAALNRPDELCFVLVDYKGGAAFADCAELPHTVGLVTDLDDQLVQRALTSLRAELTYREERLNDVGAKNIGDYQRMRDRDPTLDPLPRLMLVIDEFAALAGELPDFVDGLIDFAQRGRSLGMHLVLATQRPAGVVSGPIRANTNLRICLRVTSPSESADVIDAPDAAMISPSTPGRGVMRSGPSAVHAFQGARVSTQASTTAVMRPPWARPVTLADKAAPEPKRPAWKSSDGDGPTDLRVLVSTLHEAVRIAGCDAPRKPWLPALPEVLGASPRAGAPVRWAVADRPEHQDQTELVGNLETLGHVYFMGAARSGRTTALRTLAATCAVNYSVSDLHIYGIDCGNGGLLPLAGLPHAGAIVPRTAPELIRKLLARITTIVTERGRAFAGAGVGSVEEWNASAAAHGRDRLPHVMMLLDRWEGWVSSFADIDAGALHAQLMNILAEGASVGVHMIISGDRSLGTGRLLAFTETRFVMRMNEDNDYTLLGLGRKDIPTTMPPGRAIDIGTGHHAQVAVLTPPGVDASEELTESSAQAEVLAGYANALTRREQHTPAGSLPVKIRALPDHLSRTDFEAMLRDEWPCASDTTLPVAIGVGGEQVTPCGPDLSAEPVFAVAGSARSGRSTLLATMARQIMAANRPVVVLAPRPSPLRDLAAAGVPVFTDAEVAAADLAAACEQAGTVLIVDDAELVRRTACSEWLADYLLRAADTGKAAIFGGTAAELASGLSGWPVALRRARRGVLTSITDLLDGEVLGVRLMRSMVQDKPTPGRAFYHDGNGALIQVAHPE